MRINTRHRVPLLMGWSNDVRAKKLTTKGEQKQKQSTAQRAALAHDGTKGGGFLFFSPSSRALRTRSSFIPFPLVADCHHHWFRHCIWSSCRRRVIKVSSAATTVTFAFLFSWQVFLSFYVNVIIESFVAIDDTFSFLCYGHHVLIIRRPNRSNIWRKLYLFHFVFTCAE